MLTRGLAIFSSVQKYLQLRLIVWYTLFCPQILDELRSSVEALEKEKLELLQSNSSYEAKLQELGVAVEDVDTSHVEELLNRLSDAEQARQDLQAEMDRARAENKELVEKLSSQKRENLLFFLTCTSCLYGLNFFLFVVHLYSMSILITMIQVDES